MNDASKVLATGLFHVLEPLAYQYNERIAAIYVSQQALTAQIDALTKEMEYCYKDAEFVDVSEYVKKLGNARAKVFKVATSLNNVSERLTRMVKQAKYKYPELAHLHEHYLAYYRAAAYAQQAAAVAVATTASPASSEAAAPSDDGAQQATTSSPSSAPDSSSQEPYQYYDVTDGYQY